VHFKYFVRIGNQVLVAQVSRRCRWYILRFDL
jgi:hypothetical protein